MNSKKNENGHRRWYTTPQAPCRVFVLRQIMNINQKTNEGLLTEGLGCWGGGWMGETPPYTVLGETEELNGGNKTL